MPPVLSRLQLTFSSFLAWCRSLLSDSNTVIVSVETGVDESHESSSELSQKTKQIRIRGGDKGLRLHGLEVGQLREESVSNILDVHPHCNMVLSVTVTCHTHLSSIPISIGKFSSLTWLDISSNNLQDLPWSVVYLRCLKVLNLANNKFSSIPPIIGHLTTLEELALENNHLQYLPTSLIHLKLLTVLSVSGNKMLAPPSAVCQLGIKAVMTHLQKRLGRSNLWTNCKQYYTEPEGGLSPPQEYFQMKSLLEISIATVLSFRLDYFSQAHIPPPLKRHLHDRSLAALEAVRLAKCSRCLKYYSTRASFDGHDCVRT